MVVTVEQKLVHITDMVATADVPGVDGLRLVVGQSTVDFDASAEADDTTSSGTILYSAGAYL